MTEFTQRNRLVVFVTLLGFALRMAGLGWQSLWYDEAFSLVFAQIDWPIFWTGLLSDGVHPPGYYLLLRKWLVIYGTSEFALRFPSVITGTLSITLIYQLGNRLHSRRLGLAAAALLALNPFALWYAQEGRMYSLLLFLTVGSGYAFWQLINYSSWKWWLALTLFSAAAFSTHYFSFIFSLVQFLFLMLMLRHLHHILRWWFMAQAVAIIPFLPWAWAIAHRDGGSFGISWIPPVTLLDLPLTMSNLVFGFSNPGQPLTWIALILIISAIGLGSTPAQVVFASRYFVPAFYRYLLLWLFIPPLFVWLLSLRQPFYVDRHLIIVLPALLLLVGTVALSSIRPAKLVMLLLLGISVVASLRLWVSPALTKEDWRNAAAAIQAAEGENDVLIMREMQTSIPFRYYYQGELKTKIAAINRQTFSLDELTAGHTRAWIVFRRPFEPTHTLAGSRPYHWRNVPDPTIQSWLLAHHPQLETELTFPGVYIVRYQLQSP